MPRPLPAGALPRFSFRELSLREGWSRARGAFALLLLETGLLAALSLIALYLSPAEVMP